MMTAFLNLVFYDSCFFLVEINLLCRTDLSTELDCTKALLHTKEMENLSVIRELEEVKALLALIRVKAAAEVVQAKQQAAEKDLQLQVAQQALQSLKLVVTH
jgi:hypothetical protein